MSSFKQTTYSNLAITTTGNMTVSPLRTLVSRRVCTCANQHAAIRPLTRSFASSATRYVNAPSPTAGFVASPEDLRRKYQPKPEEVDRTKREISQLKQKNRKASLGILLCTIAMFGTVYLWPKETKLIQNEAPPPSGIGLPDTSQAEAVELVQTGTSSVPTFPKTIHLSELDSGTNVLPDSGDQEYQLVGLGIRTVSFLSIQVYVVGLYVALPDIAVLQERLIRTQDPVATTLVPGEKGKLREALLDADKSEDIWNEVLKDGGIRSVFRIVPTRNTDYSHLKDGFLRQITGKTQHFAAKRNDQTFSDESFGQAVNEFKTFFNGAPKKNLPKGEILLLGRDAKGSLSAWYEDPKGDRTRFGQIDDERLSRCVWLQYLSGSNPSSESARKNIVEGVMEYVARPVGTIATRVV